MTTNHDIIVSRVFKVGYFSRENLCFISCSIHVLQVMVKGGVRWRICDVSRIRVWNDPWIRDQDGDFVFGPTQYDAEDMKRKHAV